MPQPIGSPGADILHFLIPYIKPKEREVGLRKSEVFFKHYANSDY